MSNTMFHGGESAPELEATGSGKDGSGRADGLAKTVVEVASRVAGWARLRWQRFDGSALRRFGSGARRVVGSVASGIREGMDMRPSVDPQGSAPGELPGVGLNGNWRLPPSRQPQLMVHDLGPSLEAVRSAFLERICGEAREDLLIGRPAEMSDVPEVRRALRFVHRIQGGHCSTTEIVMRTEGDDLYVSFGSRARTLLTYLNFGGRGLLIGLGVVLAMTLYLSGTGARVAWAKDYADRRAAIDYEDAGAAAFMANRLIHGGQTIDWAWFHQQVWSDQQAAAAVAQYVDRVIEAECTMPGMEYFLRPVYEAHGRHILQVLLAEHFPAVFAEALFPWFDPAQHIYVRTNDGTVHTDTYALTFVEVPDATPFLQLIASLDQGLAQSVVPILERSVVTAEPWTLTRLAKEDPRTALFNLGMPITLLLSLFGFFVWRAPRSWLRFPCRALRWITPEEFDAQALSRNAWVERQMSKTLAEFGVGRAQVTELNGASNAV